MHGAAEGKRLESLGSALLKRNRKGPLQRALHIALWKQPPHAGQMRTQNFAVGAQVALQLAYFAGNMCWAEARRPHLILQLLGFPKARSAWDLALVCDSWLPPLQRSLLSDLLEDACAAGGAPVRHTNVLHCQVPLLVRTVQHVLICLTKVRAHTSAPLGSDVRQIRKRIINGRPR